MTRQKKSNKKKNWFRHDHKRHRGHPSGSHPCCSPVCVQHARGVLYLSNHITTPNGVDESIYLLLDGQEQYLLIRGKDVNNPVIIWLHGGPSGPDAL